MKDHLQKSILGFFKDVEKHGQRIAAGFDMEDVHQFRTATKKLRSLLRLQEVNTNFFPKRFLKSYHYSGDLRNAQLLLAAITEQSNRLPKFAVWLATYIGNNQYGWRRNYREDHIDQLKKSLEGTAFKQVPLKTFLSFCNNHLQKVIAIMGAAEPSDDDLHTIRKRIKDILYLRQWSRKHWPEGWKGTKDYPLVHLKKLADVAGNYNDLETALLLVDEYLKQEKDVKAIKAMKIIQKRQLKQSETSRKALMKAIGQFLQRYTKEPGGKNQALAEK